MTYNYQIAMNKIVILILCLGLHYTTAGRYRLHDKQLLYYEPLHFETEDLHIQHEKYSTIDDNVSITFHAFNRNFTLVLKRIRPSPNLMLRHKREISVPDLSFMYTGYDQEYPGSTARISIINGTFHGKIKHSGETIYHVVPSSWFFTGLPPFHTIIYSENHYNWTHSYDTEVLKDDTQFKFRELEIPNTRVRRALPDNSQLQKRVCPVKVTTDLTVWNYYMKLNQNKERTKYDITSIVQNHIDETNEIFESTIFSVKGNNLTGVKLELKQIDIYETSDCDTEENESVVCNMEHLDYNGVLDMFDTDIYYALLDDYEETDIFCVSMLITARVLFKNNQNIPILGLSNLAQAPGYDKGICKEEFNTGYITLFQHDDTRAVAPHISQTVFAHEVAHVFGAYHDNNQMCSQYNLKNEPDGGFYIMNSVPVFGSKPNNRKFSECSRYYISKTLENAADCFTDGDSAVSQCGNGVIEVGEECDSGDMYNTDNCCHPPNDTQVHLRCRLKDWAQCSPSQGPCCNSVSCKPINSTEKFVCQNRQECVDTLYCKGETHGVACPDPDYTHIKPDDYICNKNGRMCEHGSCTASVCKLIGWTECGVTADTDQLSIEDKENLCYLGCREPVTGECISTRDMNKVAEHNALQTMLLNISISQKTNVLSIQLPVGTPCNGLRGFCDIFRRCRGADPDTPLVQLKECILNGECIKQLISFCKEYWYAVVLGGIAAIILSYGLVSCLAVHTKSSNPSKPRRLSFKESSVRMRDSVTSIGHNVRHSFRRRSTVRSQSQEPDELCTLEGISEFSEKKRMLREDSIINDDVFRD